MSLRASTLNTATTSARPTRVNPGDSVLYCGPTKGRYLPAEIPGQVERVSGKRAFVRYPWGLQHIAAEKLRVVERARSVAA